MYPGPASGAQGPRPITMPLASIQIACQKYFPMTPTEFVSSYDSLSLPVSLCRSTFSFCFSLPLSLTLLPPLSASLPPSLAPSLSLSASLSLSLSLAHSLCTLPFAWFWPSPYAKLYCGSILEHLQNRSRTFALPQFMLGPCGRNARMCPW